MSKNRSVVRCVLVVLGSVLPTLPGVAVCEEAAWVAPAGPRVRQPMALQMNREGSRLFVANRRSGSLSIVDPRSSRVVAEYDVGKGLSDLALLPDGRHVLAVDQQDDALLLLEVREDVVRVVARRAVSRDPTAVVATADGACCAVASTWSRQLTLFALEPSPRGDDPTPKITHSVALPFSPRNMVYVRAGSRLVVTDAFGGGIAIVDPARGVLESCRTLPGHNIRGLAVAPDGKSLAIAHQVILPRARTDFEDIHWGLFVNNDLLVVDLDRVLAEGSVAELLRGTKPLHLSNTGSGAGDPTVVTFDRQGHTIVLLAGVDEVLIGAEIGAYPHRPGVGRRPVAVALSPDTPTAFVANSFDDSLAILDLERGKRTGTLALGPCPDLTAAERGERLFSDARLSHDSWMSCQSCHTDGHSNGINVDTLGDGDYGAAKRVPSLLGTATTGPWGWDGRFQRIEDQVTQSIDSTMQGRKPRGTEVADLVAYLETLKPPAPRASDSPQERRGRERFERDCASCHAGPDFTSPARYDVGLADEAGNRKFNPPSLRGVAGRAPLLHDGRASSLEEVFRRHKHPRGIDLAPDAVADLVSYLKTL